MENHAKMLDNPKNMPKKTSQRMEDSPKAFIPRHSFDLSHIEGISHCLRIEFILEIGLPFVAPIPWDIVGASYEAYTTSGTYSEQPICIISRATHTVDATDESQRARNFNVVSAKVVALTLASKFRSNSAVRTDLSLQRGRDIPGKK